MTDASRGVWTTNLCRTVWSWIAWHYELRVPTHVQCDTDESGRASSQLFEAHKSRAEKLERV